MILAAAVEAADAQSPSGGASGGPGDEGESGRSAASQPQSGDGSSPANTPVAFQLAQAPGPAQAAVEATSQTVSRLATEMVKKLQAKATRFQLELEPAGLGRVNVNIRIGTDGAVTAALNFDNAGSAAALKAHAGELQAALEQAGFNLTGQDLSFTTGGFGAPADGGSSGQRTFHAGFTSIADTAQAEAEAQASASSRASDAGGVDIRI